MVLQTDDKSSQHEKSCVFLKIQYYSLVFFRSLGSLIVGHFLLKWHENPCFTVTVKQIKNNSEAMFDINACT